jgi:phosphatidylglycerophosphate synthase
MTTSESLVCRVSQSDPVMSVSTKDEERQLRLRTVPVSLPDLATAGAISRFDIDTSDRWGIWHEVTERSGRKIPSMYENPIDNILLYPCEKWFGPLAYNAGLTPNMVTAISCPFLALSAQFVIEGFYARAALYFLIYYWMDCLDGNMARRYDMVTVFGDYFDHLRDWIGGGMVVAAILYRWFEINPPFYTVTLPVLLVAGGQQVGMMIHMGCQESYCKAVNEAMAHEASTAASEASSPKSPQTHSGTLSFLQVRISYRYSLLGGMHN